MQASNAEFIEFIGTIPEFVFILIPLLYMFIISFGIYLATKPKKGRKEMNKEQLLTRWGKTLERIYKEKEDALPRSGKYYDLRTQAMLLGECIHDLKQLEE